MNVKCLPRPYLQGLGFRLRCDLTGTGFLTFLSGVRTCRTFLVQGILFSFLGSETPLLYFDKGSAPSFVAFK